MFLSKSRYLLELVQLMSCNLIKAFHLKIFECGDRKFVLNNDETVAIRNDIARGY